MLFAFLQNVGPWQLLVVLILFVCVFTVLILIPISAVALVLKAIFKSKKK